MLEVTVVVETPVIFMERDYFTAGCGLFESPSSQLLSCTP